MNYCIINSLDASNREFVKREDLSSYTILDWYNLKEAPPAGVNPSAFPCFVLTLPQTGGLAETFVNLEVSSVKEAEAKRDEILAERDKAGAELPPLPPPVQPLDLDRFYEEFSKAALSGQFSAEQWTIMKMLADVKQDVAFRDTVLQNVAKSGTDEQRVLLGTIAYTCGVPLPDLGGK